MQARKTAKHTAMLTGLSLLAWAGAVHALPPSEPLFFTRDLVVIGKVMEVRDPVQRSIRVPRAAQDLAGRMRSFQVEVAEVLRDTGGTVRADKNDERRPSIEVVAEAREQLPAGQSPPPGTPPTPVLEKGMSYVFLLAATTNGGVFFLPSEMTGASCQPASDALVAAVRKMADVANWPWGAEQNGLQLAFLKPDKPEKLNPLPARFYPNSPPLVAMPGFLVAVRNTTTNLLAVKLDSGKRPFTLEGSGPKGQSVTHDIFWDVSHPGGSMLNVEAGQIAFLRPAGSRGIPTFPVLNEGTWTFRLTCAVEQAAAHPAWHGTVQTKPLTVEIEK